MKKRRSVCRLKYVVLSVFLLSFFAPNIASAAHGALSASIKAAVGEAAARTKALEGWANARAVQAESPVKRQKRYRTWLGVLMQPLTPALAEAFGLVEMAGVLVGDVKPGGPAHKGGIKAGDVIVKFNGHYIRTMPDLPAAVTSTPPGKAVEVDVVRNEKVKTLKVTLVAIEIEDPRQPPRVDRLGMEIREITPHMAERLSLENADGVVVWEVNPEKPAAQAGLMKGDVILEVNRHPIHKTGDYNLAISNITDDRVLFLVKRGRRTLFIAVNLE